MPYDAMKEIKEAEARIVRRDLERRKLSAEARMAAAAEAVADDLTRLVAEVRTLRSVFALYAAKP